MSAARIAELAELIADRNSELVQLRAQLDTAERTDLTFMAADIRTDIKAAEEERAEYGIELKGLGSAKPAAWPFEMPASESVCRKSVDSVRVADQDTSMFEMEVAALRALLGAQLRGATLLHAVGAGLDQEAVRADCLRLVEAKAILVPAQDQGGGQ